MRVRWFTKRMLSKITYKCYGLKSLIILPMPIKAGQCWSIISVPSSGKTTTTIQYKYLLYTNNQKTQKTGNVMDKKYLIEKLFANVHWIEISNHLEAFIVKERRAKNRTNP